MLRRWLSIGTVVLGAVAASASSDFAQAQTGPIRIGFLTVRTGALAADHVARVMDALSLPPTVDVFGNGFGAFVALELAIRHGGRMGRLMVADTAPAFPEPAKAPFRGMAEKVRATGMSAILRAVYRDIEDSGHCPMLEQPEALVSMIESFTSGSASSPVGDRSTFARLGG